MTEPTMEQKQEMVNRAIEQASIHNIEIPVRVGDHITHVAKMILGAFTEYGAEELYDYWKGNFTVFGLA